MRTLISDLRSRIEANSVKTEEGCWEWQLALSPKGYGSMSVKGVTKRAHRVSYTVFNGPIEDGMVVMHTCDNPKCVNPSHLLVGTSSDNRIDCTTKGRHHDTKGEKHPNAKLTEEMVRELYSDSRPYRKLTTIYGVSIATISAIKGGKRWRHVTSTLENTK